MSSVSPGNPADGLASEGGQVHNWLQKGLGVRWHAWQTQRAFSWGPGGGPR